MTHIMNISKQAVLWSVIAVLVSTSVLFAVFVPREASAAVLIDGCYFKNRIEYLKYKDQLNSGGIFHVWCNGFSGLTQLQPSGYSSYPTAVTSTVKYIPGSSR